MPKRAWGDIIEDLFTGRAQPLHKAGKGVGIYDDKGIVRVEMMAAICDCMGSQGDRLIWEATQKNQQTYLIRHFGSNANLGNIPPGHVLALEALRVGLRLETFAPLVTELQHSGQWVLAAVEEQLPDAVE